MLWRWLHGRAVKSAGVTLHFRAPASPHYCNPPKNCILQKARWHCWWSVAHQALIQLGSNCEIKCPRVPVWVRGGGQSLFGQCPNRPDIFQTGASLSKVAGGAQMADWCWWRPKSQPRPPPTSSSQSLPQPEWSLQSIVITAVIIIASTT